MMPAMPALTWLRNLLRQIWAQHPDAAQWRRLLLAVLATVGAVCLLLACAASAPQDDLRRHLRAASAQGSFDREYPRPDYLFPLSPRLDMYTECVALGIATQIAPAADVLLAAPTLGSCEWFKQKLALDAPQGAPYMRYWHGYQIFLKPLYAWLPIQHVRLLTACVTAALLLLLLCVLASPLGWPLAGLVTGCFFLTRSSNVFLLVTHAAQFWLVLAGASLAVLLRRRVRPLPFFALLGAADACLSFLNMGSLSLGLPLLCYALCLWADGRQGACLAAALFWAGIGWSLGFVAPWLIKWGAAALLLHADKAAIFNTTLEIYPTGSVWRILLALFRNASELHWGLALALAWLLWLRKRRRHLAATPGILPALLPGLVPILWVAILPGQSGIRHSTFINVILWPSLAAAFLWLACLPQPGRRPRQNG